MTQKLGTWVLDYRAWISGIAWEDNKDEPASLLDRRVFLRYNAKTDYELSSRQNVLTLQ